MTGRAAPDASLQLSWIFGYNGAARRNVHFLTDDVIVYFTAGVGVVMRLAEHSQTFFLGHNDDITSLAVAPNKQHVATGQLGDEPFICVWHAFTLETLSVLKDAHVVGIKRLSFSGNGKLLASLGMDDSSTLVVWRWQDGATVASTTGHSATVADLTWNPHTANELATCGDHHLRVWTQLGNSFKSQAGVFGSPDLVQNLTSVLYRSASVLVTGTEDGHVYLWQDRELQRVIRGAHDKAVLCLSLARDSLVTGGQDGLVKLWSTHYDVSQTLRARSPALNKNGAVTSVSWDHGRFLFGSRLSEIFVHSDSTTQCHMQGHGRGELWGLCPHPEDYLFVTAGEDHTVRVWDVEKREPLQTARLDLEVMTCAVRPDASQVAVGMKFGTVAILDFSDLSEVLRFVDRKEAISDVRYSPDGSLLAVGSHDSVVDVYETEKYRRTVTMTGSSSFITHLDWSRDGAHLLTNSGAGELLVFAAADGRHVTEAEELEGIEWHSWTGVLGAEVQGIWPRYSDLSDVNAAHADPQRGVMVTGDDFGLVKLFRYPSRKKGSKCRAFAGHSEHVTCVRFTARGTHVVSVGGADKSVFVWKFIEAPPHSEETVARRRHVETSDDDGRDTEDESFPQVYSDVEEDHRLFHTSRVSRARRQKRQAGALHTVPQQKPALNMDTKLPEAGLKLKFAYGYRGHNTRKNLHFSTSGHLVYHLAALGIVFDPAANSQRFYNRHTDDILCLTVQTGSDVVATGQMGADASIHVWSADSLETLSVLRGQHQRAVHCLSFSGDGGALASVGGDDAHTLVLWKWRTGQKLASARGHSEKVFDVSFDPTNANKLMTSGVKHVRFWTRSGGGLTWKRGILGNLDNQDTMLCCICSSERPSFSGGASGTVYCWEAGKVSRSMKAHRGPIYCIAALDKGYLTGGQDGYICLWDDTFSRCLKIYPVSNAYVTGSRVMLSSDHPSIRACALGEGRIVAGTQRGEIIEVAQDGSICVLMSGHSRGEVWGLDTHPSSQEFVTVSDDRTLRVWNRADGRQVHTAHLRKAARCVGYSADGLCLAVGFLDGSLAVYSADSLMRCCSVHHRDEQISDVKFSPDSARGRGFLAVASHEDVVDLYLWTEESQLRRVAVCRDASSYITHIDWLADGRLLRSNSGAKELLYYECPSGRRQLISASIESMLRWHSASCVLGPSVAGVWAPEDDVTDVNALHRSPDQSLVATACDDRGLIKLFRYPAEEKWSRFRAYTGHSSHVTNVRWTADGDHLISVGGADTAVLVWARVNTAEYGPGHHKPLDEDSGDELTVHDLDSGTDVVLGSEAAAQAEVPEHVRGPGVSALYLQTGESFAVVTRSRIVSYTTADNRQTLDIQQDAPVLTCATVSAHNPRLLAVAESNDGSSVSIIDTDPAAGTLAMLMTPNSPTEEIFYMQCSLSGRFLLCCAYRPGRYILRVWNWTKGVQTAEADVKGALTAADFSVSDDLKLTVICHRQVLFGRIVGGAIQLQKGFVPRKKRGSDRRYLCVTCGPEHASYTGTSDGRLLMWKGPILSLVVDVSQKGPVSALSINRNGTALLTAVRTVQGPIQLHRWTESLAADWNYTLESAPSAELRGLSWGRQVALVTTVDGKEASLTHVDMKEKQHRLLMAVIL